LAHALADTQAEPLVRGLFPSEGEAGQWVYARGKHLRRLRWTLHAPASDPPLIDVPLSPHVYEEVEAAQVGFSIPEGCSGAVLISAHDDVRSRQCGPTLIYTVRELAAPIVLGIRVDAARSYVHGRNFRLGSVVRLEPSGTTVPAFVCGHEQIILTVDRATISAAQTLCVLAPPLPARVAAEAPLALADVTKAPPPSAQHQHDAARPDSAPAGEAGPSPKSAGETGPSPEAGCSYDLYFATPEAARGGRAAPSAAHREVSAATACAAPAGIGMVAPTARGVAQGEARSGDRLELAKDAVGPGPRGSAWRGRLRALARCLACRGRSKPHRYVSFPIDDPTPSGAGAPGRGPFHSLTPPRKNAACVLM
jgi:hypothetical protein